MAEVVVAGQVGSDQVMRVMKQARKQAGGMTCGVETEDLALSAMEAAREAMNQTAGQKPAMRSTIAEVPVIEVEEEAAQVVNASVPDQAEITVEPAIKPKPQNSQETGCRLTEPVCSGNGCLLCRTPLPASRPRRRSPVLAQGCLQA
jgi:hypothetical protein